MKEPSGIRDRAGFVAMAVISLATVSFAVEAKTIRVPDDVVTIQGAIDQAANGDRVLVAPGTYFESIDFNGKAITVVSDRGAEATIIDAGGQRSVARFHTGETRRSVLKGFTLRNGNAIDFPLDGGGVQIYFAGPTIDSNIITHNTACNGNGMSVEFSSALVKNNHIHDNVPGPCGSALGGGILIGGSGTAEVTDNLIEHNVTNTGGGIAMNAAGTPLIARNVIRNNLANFGGGLSAWNDSRPLGVNNLIHGNQAVHGGGIGITVPAGAGGTWVNNTIADNIGTEAGSEIYTQGFVEDLLFVNNIARTTIGPFGVHCDDTFTQTPPMFTNNDLYSGPGILPTGTCAFVLATGGGGNISVDPQFTRDRPRTAYRLSAGSPVIDAGVPTSAAGATDAAGRPRVVDGNGDGAAATDLGAYEFKPR